MKQYKVLEVIWLRSYPYYHDFQQEYCGTFNTLRDARKYVRSHSSEWESDLEDADAIGIGIEIETWEKDSPDLDDSFGELTDTYTEWSMDRA